MNCSCKNNKSIGQQIYEIKGNQPKIQFKIDKFSFDNDFGRMFCRSVVEVMKSTSGQFRVKITLDDFILGSQSKFLAH